MAAKLILLCIVVAIHSINSQTPTSSTASVPSWPGIYSIDNSCNRFLCCCLDGQLILTRMTGQKLRFQASLKGFNCPETLSVDGIIDEPTGFDTSITLLGEKSTVTLSKDSTEVSIFTINDLRCSTHAFRNQSSLSTTVATSPATAASTSSPTKPNWFGTYQINTKCDRTVCCCLSGQLEMTSLSKNMLKLQCNLVGVNCPAQATFLEQITEPLVFDISIKIGNDLSLIHLSPDSQMITVTNLANPKCSAGAMKSKGTATYGNNLWMVMMLMICSVAAAKSAL